jgi:hypothetical protein
MATTISQPRETEKFSKSFGGSLKSLIGSKGRVYFVLEHKTKSQRFRVGQTTEFIGDYIELGRGNSYAVSFGDDCNTVSRPHAAIIRKGDGWIIKNLSKVNPTIVNGQSVRNDLLLKNGDEIQLSLEGPKVLFLIPANNSTNSLGMTVRLKAMANEAIKPYKTAVITLLVLLVISISGLTYYFKGVESELIIAIKNGNQKITQLENISNAQGQELVEANKSNKKLQTQIGGLITKIKSIKYTAPPINNVQNGEPATSELSQLYPHVYFILSNKVIVELGGKTKEIEFGGSGTGFLLNDGRFVTARHVVEPWFFIENSQDERLLYLNVVASNGGKLTQYMEAYSPSGGKIKLTNNDFTVERDSDVSKKMTTNDGDPFIVNIASLRNGTDWAVSKTSKNGALTYDKQLSKSLQAATKLYVLGYPFGMGVNNINDIKPIYSECNVSRDGLDNGIIDVSSRGFDPGNSGGPVFTKVNNQFVTVGIVSGLQGSQGIIVPIGAIK